MFVSGASDVRIYNLIEAYRTYGHLLADVNPIATEPPKQLPQLTLENLGFQDDELSKQFPTCGLLQEKEAPLSNIVEVLQEIYCHKIGIEYMGIGRPDVIAWLQERIEPMRFKSKLTIDQKRMILQHLNKSELLEVFLHTKYVGQKRFSLEGAETLIPMLEAIIETGASNGLDEFVIGLAHRGRLNVLVNILQKSYGEMFSEFEDSYISNSFEGSGDVKYHKGYSSVIKTELGDEIKVSVTANPSHLEAVNGVVLGQVRAKQVRKGDDIRMERIAPILIHGDAAIAGQGVVYETMQLYDLPGYGVGGTIHIVVNNQIGFTTLPKDSRSTRYCTDIARTFGAPVFHVNAEDPEGCVHAINLAVEVRQRFHCDVIVELNGYRKYGHNEGDEPAFTQPLEYQLIRKKNPIREVYRDELIQQGVLEKYMAETLEGEFKKAMDKALKAIKAGTKEEVKQPEVAPTERARIEEELFAVHETGVPLDKLQEMTGRMTRVPEGFTLNRKLQRLLDDRTKMVAGGEDGKRVDWGMGEGLAFASLLWDGAHVRLSGQDSRRGTFSHRHAMWVDQKNARKYFPLSCLKDGQGRFDVFNSPLSEYGVLGFEFGYSLSTPEALVIWEAQFGDFGNGAQIIVDQFVATAEQKWGRKFGLTMLLPHGYEGQGPEHSSARIERFLGMSGNYNMQVVYPSTPAQMFHLLRRQALRPMKKPLVVFSPKSLLRHPRCTSDIQELTEGSFQEVLDDPTPGKKVTRVVCCSGRIYYDLVERREKEGIDDMAIIRVEQLYPFHLTLMQEVLARYPDMKEVYWVQEEPSNMGAWKFMRPMIEEVLPKGMQIKYIGRAPSASPATGILSVHKKELAELVNAVFRSEEQPFYEMSYHTVPV